MYNLLSTPEIKALLMKKGLSVPFNRDVIIERLKKHDLETHSTVRTEYENMTVTSLKFELLDRDLPCTVMREDMIRTLE
jgi:hypothetical protein